MNTPLALDDPLSEQDHGAGAICDALIGLGVRITNVYSSRLMKQAPLP